MKKETINKDWGIAIGKDTAVTEGIQSVAVSSKRAMAKGQKSVAVSRFGQATTVRENSTAVGPMAKTCGERSAAHGFRATAEGDCSTAVGNIAETFGGSSAASGSDFAVTKGEFSAAFSPKNARTNASSSVAFASGVGGNATAAEKCSVAVGAIPGQVKTKGLCSAAIALGGVGDTHIPEGGDRNMTYDAVAEAPYSVAAGFSHAAVCTENEYSVAVAMTEGMAVAKGKCGTAVAGSPYSTAYAARLGSVAIAAAPNSFAAGVLWSYLMLREWYEENGDVVCNGFKVFFVDGNAVKENVRYALDENGNLVTAEDVGA